MREYLSEFTNDSPLKGFQRFLQKEKENSNANRLEDLRFIGYVLDIGYDTATIITSDPYKMIVGGIPRNSFLIMVPDKYEDFPLHFTLLRVMEAAPTPLSDDVAQTYFELHKKSMPEIDIFTQSELQWGALKTFVLGMFYLNPDDEDKVEFSADLNSFVSAHRYRVYSPTSEILEIIVNSLVAENNRFIIGNLRMTESRLSLHNKIHPDVKSYISVKDFMGTRTALFGKTRLGKSNIVKLIVQSVLETTLNSKNVGQIIFDIEGEYANINPQDNGSSIKSIYPDRCEVYALTPKLSTESKPLKINFYNHIKTSHYIVRELLEKDKRNAAYVRGFTAAELPDIEELEEMEFGQRLRQSRKILMWWAILRKAGFDIDENTIWSRLPISHNNGHFNPNYTIELRNRAYTDARRSPPPGRIDNLNQLITEFETIQEFLLHNPGDSSLLSSEGNPLFEDHEKALLRFLDPPSGSSAGTRLLSSIRKYHDRNAEQFIENIINLLDKGQTVIIDLGNADQEIRNFYSDELAQKIFSHQTEKFTNNALDDHYIQIYFEEAHNLFPPNPDKDDIYQKIAKEGAKYHIGMVYSTQSVSTINYEVLNQTENFFIAHLSSQNEVNELAKINIAFKGLEDDILRTRTVGYIRMLTRSHRFVIPIQARKFAPLTN